MYQYEVTVTCVDYYGYPVWDKVVTVTAKNAADAKKLARPYSFAGWPRYTLSAKRVK